MPENNEPTIDIDEDILRQLASELWLMRDPGATEARLTSSRGSFDLPPEGDITERFWEVKADPRVKGKDFQLWINADGAARFTAPPQSAHLRGIGGAGAPEVVRDLEARPVGWFGGPAAADALPELTDTDDVVAMARRIDPDGAGYSEEEIAAAEAARGGRFPVQLRALYESTSKVPMVPAEWDHATGEGRWPGWWAAEIETKGTFDEGVQAIAGSPGWIPFMRNNRGELHCVDMVPGPGGRIGQVIVVSPQRAFGAELAAESVAALFRDETMQVTRALVPSIGFDGLYLKLTADELRDRLGANDLPSTLQAVAVEGGNDNLDVLEELLTHWGVPFTPRIEREWQQELPAERA